MLPVIALVGRPNVGKSTLFNRLTKTREALVANFSGLTRDRQYGRVRHADREFIAVDTCGIVGDEEGLEAEAARQSHLAIEEADIVLLLVDLRDGPNPSERELVQKLRKAEKLCFLIANKMDGIDADSAVTEFYSYGIADTIAISASQGRGINQMLDALCAALPEAEPESEDAPAAKGTRIAIIGRPNVGKSTLVNRLLGEERVVVFDEPGTTRDSIEIPYVRNDSPYVLIDTAGIRRRKNIKEVVEKYSIIKTLQAIQDAHVTVVLVNAQEGLVDQDLHLIGAAIDAGRALVIAVNKWDGLELEQREYVKRELDRRTRFVEFAQLHFISALHGSGVGKLYEAIDAAYESSTRALSTPHLTRILEDAVKDNQPPLVNGRRIKLRYAHAGGANPPRIVIHGNQTALVPVSYQRYLENTFRRVLKLEGTPVKIEFKTGDNPFAGRKNKLTARQVTKKRRMMKHVKKK
ncbi:MAG: ribosome biogenesis GTPase Der [Pseudomonadales bacterium]